MHSLYLISTGTYRYSTENIKLIRTIIFDRAYFVFISCGCIVLEKSFFE